MIKLAEHKEKAWKALNKVLIGLGLLSLLLFKLIIGFDLEPGAIHILLLTVKALIGIYILQELARWFFVSRLLPHLRENLFVNLVAIVFLINILFPGSSLNLFYHIAPGLSAGHLTVVYLAVMLLGLFAAIGSRVLRHNELIGRISVHPATVFALSFGLIIFFGAVFLMLPNSTNAPGGLNAIDALFTSTSAVCVTGLSTLSTAHDFSLLGQIIILVLMQIGGLGVMTITSFFAMYVSGGASFRVRIMMKDLMGQGSISGASSLLRKIMAITFSFEILGAIALYFSAGGSWHRLDISLVWQSLFHSVSGFCNAGFSLYDSSMGGHLMHNYPYLSVLMILITLGGLGFAVISNLLGLRPWRRRQHRLRRQLSQLSKIVIITSAILVVGGAIMLWAANSPGPSGIADDMFHSLFLSVTARTAGFNTIEIGGLSTPALFIMMALMWIGASPGSTGGGIKTTTFAIAAMSLWNYILGRKSLKMFWRKVPEYNIFKAHLVVFSSLIFLGLGSIALVWIEPGLPPVSLIFEACSAVSTVGLSCGVTSALGSWAKIVIIALMFIGRIGVLAFFTSFLRPKPGPRYSLPESDVMIG